jgi:hypothetical protein
MQTSTVVYINTNLIGDDIVRVLASSAIDRVVEPRSGQAKDYIIGTCCYFPTNQLTFRSKNKCWLARNQDNVS